MYSFIVSTLLNGTLLAQWIFYRVFKKKAPAPARKADSEKAPKSPVAAAAAAAAEPAAAAAPTSDKAPTSDRGSRRRPAHAK